MVNSRTGKDAIKTNKYVLQVNPRHEIIIQLDKLRESKPSLADKIAHQVL